MPARLNVAVVAFELLTKPTVLPVGALLACQENAGCVSKTYPYSSSPTGERPRLLPSTIMELYGTIARSAAFRNPILVNVGTTLAAKLKVIVPL